MIALADGYGMALTRMRVMANQPKNSQGLVKVRHTAAGRPSRSIHHPEAGKAQLLGFDEKLNKAMGDIVDSNFELYKRIMDDKAFGESLVEMLFERYIEAREEG